MAPPKTQAQIDADAAAAKANAEAEQRSRDAERQSGFFDFLKGLIPDFSFFGLLEMALVVTGLYFLAKVPGVQNFIGDMVGKLSPEWQANILGFMNQIGIDIDMGAALEKMDYATLHTKLKDQVPAEILDIIDPNDNNKTLHEFLDVIRGANGGKVTMKGFTSAETITALIQQKPDMARALVIAAMKPGADGQPSTTAQQMNASIKTIIASTQLDTMLSTANRANTIKILAAALPADAPINEAGLARLITEGKGLDANGVPTADLRQLLNDAVDRNKDGIVADIRKIMGTKDMVVLADPAKMPGESAKYVTATLQQNPRAKAAQDALIDALGEAQAGAFLNALQAPDAGKQISELLVRKENVHALPQAVALLNQLPDLGKHLPAAQAAELKQAREFLTPAHIPAIINIVNNNIKPLVLKDNFLPNGKFSMDHAVDLLLNPTVRSNLVTAGTANVAALTKEMNPMLTQRNIDAIIKFAGAIDGGNPSPNSKLIMHRLAKIATGTSMGDAFKGLTGEQLATFFSVPANRAAFNGLLDARTGIVGNTPVMQQELALLRKDFNVGTGVGLGAILSDKDSAQFLLNHSGNGPDITPEFVKRGWMMAFGGTALDNAQNRDILIELGKTLNNGTTQQAAAPAPKANNYGRYSGLPMG